MIYKVKKGTVCDLCRPSKKSGCNIRSICEERVFRSVKNGKLYAFVHDNAGCGGMMECEPKNPPKSELSL